MSIWIMKEEFILFIFSFWELYLYYFRIWNFSLTFLCNLMSDFGVKFFCFREKIIVILWNAHWRVIGKVRNGMFKSYFWKNWNECVDMCDSPAAGAWSRCCCSTRGSLGGRAPVPKPGLPHASPHPNRLPYVILLSTHER